MKNSHQSKSTCEAADHTPHSHKLRSETVLTKTATLFHALGDTERLKLIELLFDGPHCVSELAEETGQSMSMISQRLKILHQAKLVQRQRTGKHIFYSLWDQHIVHLLENAFEHVEEPNK
jgi:ArsR family transcriptional regulator